MKQTVIVVGGVAGGMSFATRLRRLNQEAEIIVFDRGPYVSFANCGLPYHLSDEIPDREDLIVVDKDTLARNFNLKIYTETTVTAIDPVAKKVTAIHAGVTSVYHYDKLVLSPGADPLVPNIPGVEQDHVFTLRNIPDVDKIKAYLVTKQPKHAVVVGGGFIGLEMTEVLAHRGISVTVVEMAPYVLSLFDADMAQFVAKTLKDNDVQTFVNTQVTEVGTNYVILSNGEKVPADLVIMSAGVRPATGFLKNTGIALTDRGAIIVDQRLQTSISDIYAVGDAIVTPHTITGDLVNIALASPANRQGRQLGDILGGLNVVYKGTLGTSIMRLFNMTFAMTGLNERQLRGKNYQAVHLSANHHASYFPGATPVYLKVLFNPDTEQIYGAQAAGENGVDKRIDVIATAIKGGIKVTDLQELELAYAPPYGSSKDMVNMVGYVAQNIVLGQARPVQIGQLDDLIKAGAFVVDLRARDEVALDGKIATAVNIPNTEIDAHLDQLPKDRKILLFCASGIRAHTIETKLRALGYDAYTIAGSFNYFKIVKGGNK